MARLGPQFLDDHSGDAETQVHIDDLIRPGLLRVYPLPAAGHTSDDRFCRLLEALAQRGGGAS